MKIMTWLGKQQNNATIRFQKTVSPIEIKENIHLLPKEDLTDSTSGQQWWNCMSDANNKYKNKTKKSSVYADWGTVSRETMIMTITVSTTDYTDKHGQSLWLRIMRIIRIK